MVNSPLIRPYFLEGGGIGGRLPLDSHEYWWYINVFIGCIHTFVFHTCVLYGCIHIDDIYSIHI